MQELFVVYEDPPVVHDDGDQSDGPGPQQALDGENVVFARVEHGMDTVAAEAGVPAFDDKENMTDHCATTVRPARRALLVPTAAPPAVGPGKRNSTGRRPFEDVTCMFVSRVPDDCSDPGKLADSLASLSIKQVWRVEGARTCAVCPLACFPVANTQERKAAPQRKPAAAKNRGAGKTYSFSMEAAVKAIR